MQSHETPQPFTLELARLSKHNFRSDKLSKRYFDLFTDFFFSCLACSEQKTEENEFFTSPKHDAPSKDL